MATTYPFSLVTLAGKVFEGEVESIVAPGESGSFGVLASHAQMVSALAAGVLEVQAESGRSFYAVSGGVCEVRQNHALVLCDKAIKVESVEEAKESVKTAFAGLK